MDYQTNLEIAQDDQRFPAYRVELRSPFDRKYVKSYDNLAQGANTAFAPQGGHNGLWTANQANRVGRQSMERYHGGVGVGAAGNNSNCNPVNPPNIQNCQLPQGYVSYANNNPGMLEGACQTVQGEGPNLCSYALKAPNAFSDQFGSEVSSQYQCPATQYITQNCGGGGGPPPSKCNCSPQMWREQCGCNSPSGSGTCNDPNIPSCNPCLKDKITEFQQNNNCTVGSGSECGNCLNGIMAGTTFCPNNDSTCCGLCPNS